jgi:putative heme iron utilization protein
MHAGKPGSGMNVDPSKPLRPEQAPDHDPSRTAHRILRTALKATLATLEPTTGHPYASLVLVATEPDGTPLFLISRLALHTRNLSQDARASLLIDASGPAEEAMAGPRLTLVGRARPTASSTARRRFLARHASARRYADFPDFACYALAIERVHYIAGFGGPTELPPSTLVRDFSDAGALIEAEAGILAHMNDDHSEAVELYATELAGAAPGTWHLVGVDPDGADLLHRSKAVRIDFPRRVRTAQEARQMFIALAHEARTRRAARGQN